MNLLEYPKRTAKRLLQRTLSSIGPERFYNQKNNNLLILMYHRVLPDTHPGRRLEQPGMYVSPETFRMHMQVLQSRFKLVKLRDWVRNAREGDELPKFACAVTFDDGWRDNYEYAYPVLREYGIPATIFVVSGFVGTHYSFWPNRLMRAMNNLSIEERIDISRDSEGHWLAQMELAFSLAEVDVLNHAQLDELVEKCKMIPEEELIRKLQRLERMKTGIKETINPDMMDWSQLKDMQKDGLVEIGSHTCGHRRLLDDLDGDLMRMEIEQSKIEIERQLKTPVEAFCYPNGDYTHDAVECVRRNYAFACTTQRGWNTRGSDLMRLRRVGVHDDIAADRHAFLARISGLL